MLLPNATKEGRFLLYPDSWIIQESWYILWSMFLTNSHKHHNLPEEVKGSICRSKWYSFCAKMWTAWMGFVEWIKWKTRPLVTSGTGWSLQYSYILVSSIWLIFSHATEKKRFQFQYRNWNYTLFSREFTWSGNCVEK